MNRSSSVPGRAALRGPNAPSSAATGAPTGTALGSARISKKTAPDQPGAKRWLSRYGDQLLCVRYRHDPAGNRRVVTVELLVDERPLPAKVGPRAEDPVMVRIVYGESDLAAHAKAWGARWDPQARLWAMTRERAIQAGLAERIQVAK